MSPHRTYLVVSIEEQEGGGEQGIALRDEVQSSVLPEVGRIICLHARQLHVQHHLRAQILDN